MTDFFTNAYSAIGFKDDSLLERIHVKSALRLLVRRCANVCLPMYFALSKKPIGIRQTTVEEHTGTNDIIISLTSFPARIHTLWLTIETLLRQTTKPTKIILWLYKDQFKGISLPKRLLAQQARGLEIEWVDENIRSYTKFYYTMRKYPQATFVTVDDDIYYSSTMLADLLATAQAHPSAIVAHFTRTMVYKDDALLPYTTWKPSRGAENTDLFLCGCGGVLYPVGSLHPDVLDIDTARRICPLADDIWLNAMAQLQHTQIVRTARVPVLLPVRIRHNQELKSTNWDGGNDAQLNALQDYCNEHYHRPAFTHSTNA